ncbi:hypothetical protein J6W91_03320 [Candidatus Saccharibacteria bacterium]|nr:hypothetical protein [Candidatus Saccharibacteria bacterium]
MKISLKKITVLVFATFLIFATVETLAGKTADVSAKNREENAETLEVPKTGTVEKVRTSETYETLVEIAFLALTGVGFYALNVKRGNSP